MDNIDCKERFTVEEINLMCLYDTNSLSALRNDLVTALHDVYQPDMIILFGSTLEKLDTITDEEFADIGFYAAEDMAAFDFDDNEAVYV